MVIGHMNRVNSAPNKGLSMRIKGKYVFSHSFFCLILIDIDGSEPVPKVNSTFAFSL